MVPGVEGLAALNAHGLCELIPAVQELDSIRIVEGTTQSPI